VTRSLDAALVACAALALVGATVWAGAARPPALLVLAATGGVSLLVASARAQRRRLSVSLAPLALPPLAMAALCALQLVPLPPLLVRALAPETARTTARVLGELGWRPLTADAAATAIELARLVGLAALALALGPLGVDRLRPRLRAVMLTALGALTAMGLFGAAGVAWPRALVPLSKTRAVLAFPLVNPNHAAALIAALLPTAIAAAVRASGGAALGLWLLVASANAALVGTASRAGCALGLAAQLAMLALFGRRGGRTRIAAVLLVATAAASVGAIAARTSDTGLEGRLAIVGDALPLVRDHAAVGVGRGAFDLVFPRYDAAAGEHRHAFVENEYVQAAADFGVPGALLILLAATAIARCFRGALANGRSGQAAAIGLLAIALHGLVDFSWEVGAVAAAACALGALAFPRAGRRLRPIAAAAIALAALAAVALAARVRTAVEDEAAVRAAPRAEVTAIAEAALRRHPADGFLADLAAERLGGDAHALAWAERALVLGPRDPLAHRAAARALARAGFRDQAAGELRVSLEEGGDLDLAASLRLALALFADDPPRLLRALPEPRRVLAELAAAQRWSTVDALAAGALADAPDDVSLLMWRLRAARARGEGTAAAALAMRLSALSPAPDDARLAADALAEVGHTSEAQALLTAAAARAPDDVELTLARARLATPADARALLDDVLARAIAASTKAVLHQGLAEAADRAGDIHTAARERAEAARLAQH
jgi:hypothetical protein